MEISKKSLHYKIINFLWKLRTWDWQKNIMPKTLCSYFWYMVFSPIIPVITLIVVLFGVLAAMVLAFVSFGGMMWAGIIAWNEYNSPLLSDPADLWAAIMLIGFQLIIWTGIFLSIFSNYNSFLNVITGYIKAKKQKVCPIIQYKD